jgi:hypothetical protein
MISALQTVRNRASGEMTSIGRKALGARLTETVSKLPKWVTMYLFVTLGIRALYCNLALVIGLLSSTVSSKGVFKISSRSAVLLSKFSPSQYASH